MISPVLPPLTESKTITLSDIKKTSIDLHTKFKKLHSEFSAKKEQELSKTPKHEPALNFL